MPIVVTGLSHHSSPVELRERFAFTEGQLAEALGQLREGPVLDLVAVDLRIATNAIGEIVGKTTTEDLLDSIFSTFCIGK